MNEPILFTPQDIVNAILAICGAITAVAAATTVIVKIVTSIKRPNKIQDQKIADLEKSVKEIREDMEEKEKEITRKFRATSQSIDDAQEAAVVTQRAFAVKQTGGASVLDAVMHAHCRVVIRYVIRFHFVSLFIVLIVMYGIPPGNIRHKSRCLIVNCAAPIPMPRHNNLSHVS